MISPRWRMVLRDLSQNYERAMLVVAAIAIGVFGVGTLLVGYSILVREINSGYMTTNPASVRLWTDRVDASLLTAVRGRPNVLAAEERRTLPASLLTSAGDWEQMALSAPLRFERMQIDTFFSDTGSWPPKPGEILIERSSMLVTKAPVGSWVTVKMPSGVQKRLRVAGTAHSPGVTPGWMSHLVYGYVSPETLTLLGEDRTYNELKVVLGGGPLNEAETRRAAFELRDWMRQNGRTVTQVDIPKPGEHPNMGAMLLILNMMLAFAMLSLLLSGLLVFNLVSGIITRQRRQIGVMKAVGATTRQVMGLYIGMVVMLGLAAAAIAMPLAWLAGRGFAGFVLGVFNLNMVRSDSPAWVFAAQLAVALLVPVLAALYPAYRGSATTVLSSLRDSGGSGSFGTGWIDVAVARVGGLGRPFALSLRNTFRRKGRLALTLLSLALGGAVFMTAINVSASLTKTINASYDRRNYDIEMRLARSYPRAAVEECVRSAPGVVAAEAWQDVRGAVVREDGTLSNDITVIGLPPQTPLISSPLSAGRWLEPGDAGALVVTPTLADKEPQMRVGSHVTLRIDERDSSWLVVGAVREVGSGMTAYAPNGYLTGTARTDGLANDVRVASGRSDPASTRAALRSAQTRLEDTGIRVVAAQTVASGRQVLVNHVAVTLTFLLLVSVLSSVVGAMGLASTMSINVIERTREIGVMRAVGADTHAVLRIVVLEGVLIGAASWFLAVALSIPLTRLTSTVPAAVFIRAPLDEVISANGIWIWLAIVTGVGLIASLSPAWRASRAPVPETLAYE